METQKFSTKWSCAIYTFFWLILMLVFAYLPIWGNFSFKTLNFAMVNAAYCEQQKGSFGIAANIGFVFFVAWDYYLMCKDNIPKHFFRLCLFILISLFFIKYFAGQPISTMYDFIIWRIPFCPAYIFHLVLLVCIFIIKFETVINTNLKE